MKKILPIFTFIIMFSASSQEKQASDKKIFNNDLRKANAYFARAFYAKAIPLYEKLNSKQRVTEVIENLATCYYNIGDLKSSARLYGYLVNSNSKNKTEENIFKYVQALKASGNYKDANSVSREFLMEKGGISDIEAFDAEVIKQENIIAIGNRYSLKNLSLNTENSEFGMVHYNDYFLFAGARKKDSKKNIFSKYYGWNGQAFLDIYKIHKDSISKDNITWKSFSNKVNTKFHEGTVALSKDLNTMYFTRNNYNKGKEIKDDKRITHLKLYKAEFVDSTWTNIQPLPFNGDTFSVEHPALSTDEKRLYFASDMPGTIGSFDLFYVDINSDGTFGKPINLGTNVNTEQREQFPFIASNGDLYFSSNGHFGFGGLDVFWSKSNDNNFEKPDNLGLPLNSGYDDFAYSLDESSKSGYIASNRSTGKGSDDIYSFKETKPLVIENWKQYITGVITDKATNEPIQNSKVTFTVAEEKNSAHVLECITKSDGSFNDLITNKVTLIVKASAPGYRDAERKIIIGGERNIKNDASLALVSLASIKKEEDEARAQELQKQQQLEREKLKKEQEKLKKEAEIKQREYESIIASEPNIKKIKDKLVIEIPQINFDYKLWYIRKDAKKIMQPVVDLMRKYPNMEIEIESHTDIRGNKAYNMELSQKRAESTKAYFVSKGIASSRMSAIGFGESMPLQDCDTESACNEEEHEINRRSEFVIQKLK